METRPRNAKGRFMTNDEWAAFRKEQAIKEVTAKIVDFAKTFYGKDTKKAILKAYRFLTNNDHLTSYRWYETQFGA